MKSGPVDTVKSGPVTIPIYWSESMNTFLAKWSEGAQTRKKKGRDLPRLKTELRKIAKRIAGGTVDLADLTEQQAAVCREVIRRGITVADLDSITTVQRVKVKDAIDRLLVAKSDTSTNNWRTLKTHLGQFSRGFGDRVISTIETEEIDRWLVESATALRTRRNKRASVVTLWRWSRDKGWLPQSERTAAERTDSPSLRKQKRQRVTETWDPTEMKTILETIPPAYLPWAVLSAFAGLRTLELFPDEKDPDNRKEVLQWEHVTLTGKEPRIVVPASVAKTAEKRTIPLSKNLRAWLKAIPNRKGPVCAVAVPWKGVKAWGGKSVIDKLSEALGESWRKNAFRHSYGTYRVLEVGSVGPVALEMGNSERMVRGHYHDAGHTKEASKEWFNLSPAKVDRSLKATA